MRNIRWEKNEKILKAACVLYGADFDKIMTKEKYGRFDLSDWGNGLPYEVLSKIEHDSLDMCETCGKTSRQYRDNGGWVTHHCLKHYILLKLNKLLWKLKRALKRK